MARRKPGPEGRRITCKNPNCKSKNKRRRIEVRGLCENCYKTLLRLVLDKRITWKQAVAKGLCDGSKKQNERFPGVKAK